MRGIHLGRYEQTRSHARRLSSVVVPFGPAPSFCHSLSRTRDLQIWLLTCGNAGLTVPGAADTFRIAPSGPSGREERPDEAPGAPTEGGNASRRIQAHRRHRTGGEAARSLSRNGASDAGEGREAGPSDPSGRRETTQRGSVARDRRKAARLKEVHRDRRTAARPDGYVGGRRRRMGAARRPDRRRSGLSRPNAEGGSGQLSPRNQRGPNASAGGDRRSLGLFPSSPRRPTSCATVSP